VRQAGPSGGMTVQPAASTKSSGAGGWRPGAGAD